MEELPEDVLSLLIELVSILNFLVEPSAVETYAFETLVAPLGEYNEYGVTWILKSSSNLLSALLVREIAKSLNCISSGVLDAANSVPLVLCKVVDVWYLLLVGAV